MGAPIKDLFAHYKVDANGCWIWQGSLKSTGYGVSVRHGKTKSMHRACVGQLRQWNVKYGNFQPSWLPPAGEVSLIETIEDWIGTSTQGVDHG